MQSRITNPCPHIALQIAITAGEGYENRQVFSFFATFIRQATEKTTGSQQSQP
jgi:hypothetical protein